MPEEILPPVTETVTEPVNQNEPVQTPPITEPTETIPKPEGGQPNVVELLSTVGKDVLLKSEVIQGLLENARQQEKNKLYKTIEEKDNTNKQLNETITDLQNQLKTKEDLTMEGEKLLLAKIEEMQVAQDKLIKDMEKKEQEAELAKVEAYKTSKLAEANGEIIEALVVGKTKEEIDLAIEVAKAEYQKIVAPLKQQVEELGKPNKANAPAPSNPSTPPSMEFTAEQIKAMSAQEYAKYRESLLQSLRG